jgi:hypothetical protein
MWDYILADAMNVTTLFNRMAALEQKVHKLEEAYYLQFPDRLEKDLEFQKQFSALKNPSDPDASNPSDPDASRKKP